jgi:peptidoglycan-associated lipoprotein
MRRSRFSLAVILMIASALLVTIAGCHKKVAPAPTPQKTEAPPAPQAPTPPVPTISLKVSQSAIEKGQSTDLSWNSSNASTVTIDNGIGTVEPSGSRSISPSKSTTYMARATGAGGNAVAEARVTVTEPPPPPPPSQPAISDALFFEKNIQDAYFDYDQYNIRPDAEAALKADAVALKQRPGIRITVEGHCDERGSEKYNLALGDMRANAAKDFIVAQGIDASRVDSVSYGKERNLCEEHNETCWQKNRRAHIAMR